MTRSARKIGSSHLRSVRFIYRPAPSPPLAAVFSFCSAWLLYFLLVPILSPGPVHAKDALLLEGNGVRLLFPQPLEPVARELIHMYPELHQELKKIFGWELNQPPSVVLTRDNKKFQQWARSPLTVAFAVPQRNLVAIDHSRMSRHPFSLRSTFKHELCHLLLHDQITHAPIPRWLDEGVAQWVSDGAGDILMDQKRSILNRVALSGRFIPLASLSRGFPAADDALTLAYEESKSFVEYLVGLQGREGVLRLLARMKEGESVERAVQTTYGESLNSLEREWHEDLQNAMTWFTYVSYHLYEILFAFAALITIYAAFRIMMKKRRRMKEYVDEPLL